jgi:hypothetical protein
MKFRLFRRPLIQELCPRPAQNGTSFDASKWNDLLKDDPDIARVADKLKSLGQKWVDEFARLYLPINDKQCLPDIIQTILAAARGAVNAGVAAIRARRG